MKQGLIAILKLILALTISYLILSYLSSNFNPWEWNVFVKIISIGMIIGSLRVAIEDL